MLLMLPMMWLIVFTNFVSQGKPACRSSNNNDTELNTTADHLANVGADGVTQNYVDSKISRDGICALRVFIWDLHVSRLMPLRILFYIL